MYEPPTSVSFAMPIRRVDSIHSSESAQDRWRRRSTLPATAAAVSGSPGSVTPPAILESAEAQSSTAEIKPESTGGSIKVSETKRAPAIPPKPLLHRKASSNPVNLPTVNLPQTLEVKTTKNPAMQAIKLQKKYPQVTQEEMFSLIDKFK